MGHTKYPYLSVEENGCWITYEEFLKRRVRFGKPESQVNLSLKSFLLITTSWKKLQSEITIWLGVYCSVGLTEEQKARLDVLQKMKKIRRMYLRLYAGPNPPLSARRHVYFDIGGKSMMVDELDALRVRFDGNVISYAEMGLITSNRKYMLARINEHLMALKERGYLRTYEDEELRRFQELSAIWEKYINRTHVTIGS